MSSSLSVSCVFLAPCCLLPASRAPRALPVGSWLRYLVCIISLHCRFAFNFLQLQLLSLASHSSKNLMEGGALKPSGRPRSLLGISAPSVATPVSEAKTSSRGLWRAPRALTSSVTPTPLSLTAPPWRGQGGRGQHSRERAQKPRPSCSSLGEALLKPAWVVAAL